MSVAVIMSVYKSDKLEYVRRAVDSLLGQTYNDFRVFVMCDGFVPADVSSYLDTLPADRFAISRREDNRGLAVSLNELLEQVLPLDYEFIARMDADDVSLPTRLERQVAYMQQHTDVDVVGTAFAEIDEQGNLRNKTIVYPSTHDECLRFFHKRNPMAHVSVLFRKSFFAKTQGLYPTDFVRNEDTRLWHEGFKHGCRFANIPEVLMQVRFTDSMFSNRRGGFEFAKSQLRLRKLIAKELSFPISAYFYAYATYVIMISPTFVLKMAYRFLR